VSFGRILVEPPPSGLEVAALMYTLMQTAKLAGVDSAAYLCEAAAQRGWIADKT
jgi:hypothetical protein